MKRSFSTFLLSLLCIVNSLCANIPFVTAELIGQLGNQFFITAAAVSLALDNQVNPIFPDLVNKKSENIPLNYQKIFFRLQSFFPTHVSTYYNEPHFHYAPIPYTPNMCIRGYFQSEKYFAHHKEEIINLFKPSVEITEYLQTKYGELLSHPCTVSVHLRSYLNIDPHQQIYPYYGRNYFEKAMALFPEARFLVFSNDMELCKREFQDVQGEIHFIEAEEHFHDLYLMSMCKHNIICNSTFSWWAAYLNLNPHKIVVAPHLWFSQSSGLNSCDLIPTHWLILKE